MNTTKKLLERFKMEKGYNLISLPTITLTEEEADRFIDYMVDESVMKDYARIERMGKPQKLIRAIGDALKGTVYTEDSRIVEIFGTKRLAEIGEQPGVSIAVGEVQ